MHLYVDAPTSTLTDADVKRAILPSIERGMFALGFTLPPEAHRARELPVSLGSI